MQQRFGESQWLKRKLSEDFKPSLQGYHEVKSFSGFTSQMKGTYDPLGGKIETEQAQSELDNIQRERELGDLKHQFDLLTIQRQIDELKMVVAEEKEKNENSNQNGDENEDTGDTTKTDNNTEKEGTKPTGLAQSFEKYLSNLPSAENITESKAELTGIEKLRDEKAYRDAIQAMLREVELDDTHDYLGRTLYTLKFDVSVIPGRNGLQWRGNKKKALGDINLILEKPESPDYEQLYLQWRINLDKRIREEAVTLQQRYKQNLLTEQQKQDLLIYAALYDYDKKSENDNQQNFSILSNAFQQNIFSDSMREQHEKEKNQANEVIARLVQYQYKPLNEIIEYRESKNHEGMFFPRIDISEKKKTDTKPEKLMKFIKIVKQLDENNNPYVYNIEPKEYAQNISDVAATEKMRNFVLSLQALMPEAGMKAENYTEYIKRSQNLLHGILRKPLVVGYINNSNTFGWILGPRYRIKDEKIKYEHTPVQHSLQASIVVPSWTNKIQLEYSYLWNDKVRTKKQGSLIVELPGDISSLTEGILDMKGNNLNRPQIDPSSSDIVLMADRKETVLITGDRLWRNPTVFVGNQQADKVDILPSMRALLASFDKVILPGSFDGKLVKVDLTVITSTGKDTLPQAITIKKSTQQEKKEETKVTILTIQASNGQDFKVRIQTTALPKKPYGLKLRIKPKGTKEWSVATEKYDIQSKGDMSEITFTHFKYQGKNAEMVAELEFVIEEKSVSIPLKGGVQDSFIFFQDKAMFSAKLITKSITAFKNNGEDNKSNSLTDIIISINAPDLFKKATPGFKEALNDGFKLYFKATLNNQPASGCLELKKEKEQFSYDEKDDEGEITIRSQKLRSTSEKKIEGIETIIDQLSHSDGHKLDYTVYLELPNKKTVQIIDKLTILLK